LISLENFSTEYGVLPYPGGLLDQPQFIIEAFKIIRDSIGKYKTDKLQRDKSEMKKREAKARAKVR